MVGPSRALSQFSPKTILVVGDIILDWYTFGSSRRISPEAPVPVVIVDSEEARAGGAANVALNLISLGMKVRLVGRIGTDENGRFIQRLLSKESIDLSGIVEESGYLTPRKNRIIASSQQLLRIDLEKAQALSVDTEKKILEKLPELLSGVDLVAISDYAKGFLSTSLLQAIIQRAKALNIPCISDPKGTDFRKYAGSTILKPNGGETLKAVPSHVASSLDQAAKALLQLVSIDVLMVTRSEDGISLFYQDGRIEHYPVRSKEVRDVTGAGDTVLAMISAAFACGLPLTEAVPLANVAASCAVERIGCARVSLHDVAVALLEDSSFGKICSYDAFSSLANVLHKEPLLFVRIPPCCTFSSSELMRLFDHVNGHPNHRAVAYMQGEVKDSKLLSLIASLQPLRLIVHGAPLEDCRVLSPAHVVVDL
jgi:D-beta-D-heptose 7-phosphate kinase/D-beta-D-heptose 1-phosphate adenosyltransferase